MATELSIGLSSISNEYGATGFVTHRANPGDPFSLVFVGANNISLSQALSTNSSGQSATISIIGNTIGTLADSMGLSNVGNTGGTTGMLSLTPQQYIFVGSNGISLSQSLDAASKSGTLSIFGGASAGVAQLNGSTGTMSLNAGAGMSLSVAASGLTFNNAGVQSLNGSTGTMSLNAGNNMSLSTAANAFTFANVLSSGTTVFPVASVNSNGTQTAYFSPADHLHQGIGQFQISGNTSNTSNLVYGSLYLSGGNNITLSQVSGAGAATVGIVGHDQQTVSRYINPLVPTAASVGTVMGQNSVSFVHLQLDLPVAFSRMNMYLYNSSMATSNAAGTNNFTVSAQLMTLNAQTALSNLASGSQSYQVTNSSNTQSFITGLKQLSIPFTATTLTAGDYYLAINIASAVTANTIAWVPAVGAVGNLVSLSPSAMANVSASTKGLDIVGVYSAATAATRVTYALTDMLLSGTNPQMGNLYIELQNATIF